MSKSNSKSDVGWMYEGEKSSVDAEEYLTGRKLDKHFDKHCSDFKTEKSKLEDVVKEKLVANSSCAKAIKSKTFSSGVLDLETIKKEDPLIAIKVREEKIRREIWENPLKMKRLQKIVMSAMRKKMNKMARKGQLDEFFKIFEENVPNNPKAEAESSVESRFSSSSDDEAPKSRKTKNWKGAKIPIYSPPRRRHDSDSSDEKKSKRNRNFGLVILNSSDKLTKKENSSEFPKRTDKKVEKSENFRKSTFKRKLTDEEMEARRSEMLDNAKWREQQRGVKIQKFEAKEAEEERQVNEEKFGARFLKPLVSGAMDNKSMEDRIRSKKHSLQRKHNSMETNFARK